MGVIHSIIIMKLLQLAGQLSSLMIDQIDYCFDLCQYSAIKVSESEGAKYVNYKVAR